MLDLLDHDEIVRCDMSIYADEIQNDRAFRAVDINKANSVLVDICVYTYDSDGRKDRIKFRISDVFLVNHERQTQMFSY